MSGRAAPGVDPPLAMVLVRNPVTHDSRVRREVQTLRAGGFAVVVAGVVSTAEPARRGRIDDVEVIRLDPVSVLRRGRSSGANASGANASGANASARRIGADDATVRTAARPRSAGLRGRLRRVVVTAAYYVAAIRLCRREPPALVHANDYNTMWIALAAKLRWRSRIVYDSHELWPDRNRRPEWRLWLLACEALFVRVADATITTSPGYADAIARRYRVARPVVVRNVTAATPMTVGHDGCRPPVAVYVGGLMPGRGLEQAIRALAFAPGLCIRLVGPGSDSYRASLQALARRAGVADRLELRAPVAPDDVLDAIADADLGLLLIQPVCLSYELTLPNKLFEYAAAGLPMLASDLPVIGRMVREQALGETVPPHEEARIAEAMVRLVGSQRNHAVRARVRAFAIRNTWELERPALTKTYADALRVRSRCV